VELFFLGIIFFLIFIKKEVDHFKNDQEILVNSISDAKTGAIVNI